VGGGAIKLVPWCRVLMLFISLTCHRRREIEPEVLWLPKYDCSTTSPESERQMLYAMLTKVVHWRIGTAVEFLVCSNTIGHNNGGAL
jgi:hypothetical protein